MNENIEPVVLRGIAFARGGVLAFFVYMLITVFREFEPALAAAVMLVAVLGFCIARALVIFLLGV